MNRKTIYTFFAFCFLVTAVSSEVLYLKLQREPAVVEKKKEFVALTQLPDLAISTEATYIRHRSLSSVFSIYKDDGELREYFPSTFSISASGVKE